MMIIENLDMYSLMQSQSFIRDAMFSTLPNPLEERTLDISNATPRHRSHLAISSTPSALPYPFGGIPSSLLSRMRLLRG
jgi:hypothetical protein